MEVDKSSLYDKAQGHIQKGQWQRAIGLMKAVHATDRGDPIVTLRLGDLYKKVGMATEAANFYFKTANIFADNGELTKAAATFKMLLRLDPSHEGVQERLDALAARREAIQPSRLPPPPPMFSGGVEEQKIEPLPDAPPVEVYHGTNENEAGGEAEDEALPGVVPLGETLGREAEFEATARPLSDGPAGMFTDFAKDVREPSAVKPRVKPARPAPPPERKDTGPLMGLEEDELWELFGRMERLTFGPGEAIVREGGTDDCIYIISSGRVGITTEKGGMAIKLAELGERDFFGEVAFLTGKPRTATVTALETTTVMELARTQVDDLIKKYPKVGRVLKMFHEDRVADTISTMRSVSKGFF